MREIEALEPMRFTLITERRRHAPRGRDGGADGAPGRNLLNGEELPAKAPGELAPGDRLRIETPGGGGYGHAQRMQLRSQTWQFQASFPRLRRLSRACSAPTGRVAARTTFTEPSPRNTTKCLLPSKSGP